MRISGKLSVLGVRAGLAAAFMVLSAGFASAQNAGTVMADTAIGKVLVDSRGMTVYTFDRDTTPGTSACTGTCLNNWPVFVAPANATAGGDYSIITRPDGPKQWAYKGKPLYFFAQDTAKGDTKGDGAGGGNWHVVK